MKTLCKLAPVGATLAFALVPTAAVAASGTPLTVRVEGQTRTLLPATTVRVNRGSITRFGAPKGACPSASAAGALDLATHHRWAGSWSSSFSDYLISTIFGVKYGSHAKSYWEVFVNNVPASTGACEIKAHRGQHVLFAAAPLADAAVEPLAIQSAPRTATVGRSFAVHAVSYDAKGKPHGIAGARVGGRGITTQTTDSRGDATITPTASGKLVLTAVHATTHKGSSHTGYVRAESTVAVAS